MLDSASNKFKAEERIAVSACLLGIPCRYDGGSVPCDLVVKLAERFHVVPVCPEQLGGLPTPRIPSEVQPDGRVVDKSGVDRTQEFMDGAQKAVAGATEQGCSIAVLKSRSPSCGVHEVYDGSFSGTVVAGQGIAARAFERAGFQVLDERDVARLLM